MIADTFFKTGMIESWGRGFERIKAACNENKAILPKYTAHGKGIMVLCKESTKYKKLRKELFAGTIHGIINSDENSKNDTANVTDVTVNNKIVTVNNENVTRKIVVSKLKKRDDVNQRIERIVNLIKEFPEINIEEIARKLNVTKRTILRDLDKLKKEGRVQREGSDKTGRWIVKKYNIKL